jgi:hypothetical protein
MSTLALTSNTLAVTAGAGQIEYDGQFFATDSNASRGQVERITQGTAVASTSGTSIDFTGIPAWAKKITVMYNNVSVSGTSSTLIQLGDSGGIENTGYTGIYSASANAATNSVISSTAGFIVFSNAATYTMSGLLTISNLTGNIWVAQGVFSNLTTTALSSTCSGGKTLSDVLTQVRITTVNGTDTFDAGSINIMYEG